MSLLLVLTGGAAPTVVEEESSAPSYLRVALLAAALLQGAPIVFSDAGQDLPASALDDGAWPVPTPQASPWLARQFGEQDELPPQPAAVAFDEDFWISGVPPVQAALTIALPLTSCDEVITATTALDEDYWASGVAPAFAGLRPFSQVDGEELPAGSLFGQPDEDFWNSGVAPIAASLRPFSQVDGEELPAGSLFGQPDEDFWKNPVAPAQATLTSSAFTDRDDFVPPPLTPPNFDEDYWVSGVPPTFAALRPFSQIDGEEVPAGSLFGQPDEDFWTTKPAPTVATLISLAFVERDELVVTPPISPTFDEDYWQNQVAPTLPILRPFSQIDGEEISVGSLSGQPDEDFWTTKPTPVAATLRPFSQIDGEEVPAGSLSGQPDEDFWTTKPIPVQASLRPFAQNDNEELPAGSLFGVPEELYWVSGVAPVPATSRPLPPYLDDFTPTPPQAPPDEVFWTTKPTPVASALGRLWNPDPEYYPNLSLDILHGPAGDYLGLLLGDYFGLLASEYHGLLASEYRGSVAAILGSGALMYSVIRGDLEPDMPIQVLVNGSPSDLRDCLSVVMRWKKPDGTLATVALTAVDASIGSFKRVWAGGDTDLIGVHRGQVVCTRSNGELQTFPSDGSPLRWLVLDQLASGVDP